MTSNHIDKYKFRNLWSKHLIIIKELKNFLNFNSNLKIDFVKNHIILTILVKNVILQYSKNIILDYANNGIDLENILFMGLFDILELNNPLKNK